MITKIKQSGRWPITILLVMMSGICFILSILRIIIAHNQVFLFFNWNLILAIIPWLASTAIMISPTYRTNKPILIGLLLLWILFFPNSPYILTDLFHLKTRLRIPVWYDLVEIMSFAWTGLMFGFVSLLDIEFLLHRYFTKRVTNVIIVAVLFLSSFGIYIGRYLRWNTWDIVKEPLPLILQIGDRIIDPTAHLGTWGMTLFLGILLNMIFWSIKLFTTYNITVIPEDKV